MLKLDVFDGKSKVKSIEVRTLIGEKSEGALYQSIVARQSHDREGNVSTLTKSEVRGGGKKPWKQKGLGRARAGSTRSPLWRGGGVTFGPKPRDFSKGLNRKEKYRAYITLFTRLNEEGRLKIIKDVVYTQSKTRDFIKFISDYVENPDQKIYMIVKDYNKELYLSSRNIPGIQVAPLNNIDMLPLLYADVVLMSESVAQALDERFTILNKSGDEK